MENLNLIRKIAWSYHRTTGIEFDELFSEACEAYIIAEQNFNYSKIKFTTYAWNDINFHLKNYLKKRKKTIITTSLDEVWELGQTTSFWFENLSQDAIKIAELVLYSSKKFIGKTQEENNQRLIHIMSKRGWSQYKTKQSIRELQNNFI